MSVLSKTYVDALADLTARHGALLLADKVQTGLRCCLWTQTWPRRPHVVLLAKGLNGSRIPRLARRTQRAASERTDGTSFGSSAARPATFRCHAGAGFVGTPKRDLLTDEMIVRMFDAGRALGVDRGGALGDSLPIS